MRLVVHANRRLEPLLLELAVSSAKTTPNSKTPEIARLPP
jgi:hypothetical protein